MNETKAFICIQDDGEMKLNIESTADTISDDIFRLSMDKALKAQNITKKERNRLIEGYLLCDIEQRDYILEEVEAAAIAYTKKNDVPTEKANQIEFVSWFKENYPDEVIMMIRNDGYRTFSESTEQLFMGLHPGASYLYIPRWHIWIEMKRIKGYKVSDEQDKFRTYIESIGEVYLMCFGADDAKIKVKDAIFYMKRTV